MPAQTAIEINTAPSAIAGVYGAIPATDAFLAFEFDPSVHGNVKVVPTTPDNTFYGLATIDGVDVNGSVALIVKGRATGISDGTAVMNPGDTVVCSTTTAGNLKSKTLSDGSTEYQIIGTVASTAQIPATAGAYVLIELGTPYIVPAT